MKREQTLKVFGRFLVGAEDLDGREARDAVLLRQRPVLVGVNLGHGDDALDGRGCFLPLGRDGFAVATTRMRQQQKDPSRAPAPVSSTRCTKASAQALGRCRRTPRRSGRAVTGVRGSLAHGTALTTMALEQQAPSRDGRGSAVMRVAGTLVKRKWACQSVPAPCPYSAGAAVQRQAAAAPTLEAAAGGRPGKWL